MGFIHECACVYVSVLLFSHLVDHMHMHSHQRRASTAFLVLLRCAYILSIMRMHSCIYILSIMRMHAMHSCIYICDHVHALVNIYYRSCACTHINGELPLPSLHFLVRFGHLRWVHDYLYLDWHHAGVRMGASGYFL